MKQEKIDWNLNALVRTDVGAGWKVLRASCMGLT